MCNLTWHLSEELLRMYFKCMYLYWHIYISIVMWPHTLCCTSIRLIWASTSHAKRSIVYLNTGTCLEQAMCIAEPIYLRDGMCPPVEFPWHGCHVGVMAWWWEGAGDSLPRGHCISFLIWTEIIYRLGKVPRSKRFFFNVVTAHEIVGRWWCYVWPDQGCVYPALFPGNPPPPPPTHTQCVVTWYNPTHNLHIVWVGYSTP